MNLRGKHIKQVLQRLEQLGKIDKETRKIILDEFNDYYRAIMKELGYEE